MSTQKEECDEPQKEQKIMVGDWTKTNNIQIEEVVVTQNVSTYDNAQVEEPKSDNTQIEVIAEAHPGAQDSDFIGLNTDEGQNFNIEEDIKTYSTKVTVKPDLSELSMAEKKKLLNTSNPAPKRGDPLWIKVFSDKVISRALRTRD